MKILVVCQYYYPEPFRISDTCEELEKKGHRVTVVTGVPNYPSGSIYFGYEKGKKSNETINGVSIHRCRQIPRKKGIVFRFLNYVSFSVSSSIYVSRIKEDFDIVFVYQLSPVMMATAGLKYAKKHGKKVLLYSLDLWPESLVAGGIKKGGLIYKVFHRISGKVYKNVDKLFVSSRRFIEYYHQKFGISYEEIEYMPQYAETLYDPKKCRKTPDGKLDIMFAGNVGVAQSPKTIIEAAKITSDDADIIWHIVGDGSELENCRKIVKSYNIKNVRFHGRQEADKMPEYYSKADVMLITLSDDPVIAYTVPGKLQSYMAAGKPVLGAVSGAAEEIIKESGCGICVAPLSADALAEAARRLKENKSELREYGERALLYSEANFGKHIFIEQLENGFKACYSKE